MKIISQLFSPKNRDLLKKILFTLVALFIFKLGTSITVPGATISTKNLSFFEILNAMSGGAFEKASIFALSVTPYITAQIIIQLLSMDIVPYLSDLSKQGGVGRRKLNQITRVLGIILAFVQGYMYSFAYISNGKVKFGTAFDIAKNMFIDAMTLNSDFNLKESEFNSAKLDLDKAIDGTVDKKIAVVEDIIRRLETSYKYLKGGVTRENILSKPEARLYIQMLQALAGLRGVTFK